MAPHTLSRRAKPAITHQILTIYLIAGSGLVVLLSLLWLFRAHRSKAKKRAAERTAALLRVRGVVRPAMAETTPSSTRTPSPSSQHELTASIVMPEKSITRKQSSHGLSDKAVVTSQLDLSPASSTLSLHRPLSNASFGPPRLRAMSILNPACPRHTRSSSGFTAYAQYSFPLGLSSRPTSTISTSSSQVKPVRQLFKSALPDELSLVRYGEYLAVLRSYDDGWCIVARHTSRSSRASRLSARMTSNGDNVDIGFVPEWVFVEPLRGVTVTRPFRIESINALHLSQNPPSAHARDTLISWFDAA